MTRPACIAFVVSSVILAAACGGATPPAEQAAPQAPVASSAVPAQPEPGPGAPISAPAGASTTAPGGSAAGKTADKPAAQSAPGKPSTPTVTATPAAPARPAYTRTDLREGSGREAVKGKGLSVNYTGWLYDPAQADLKGRMFDSSQGRGAFDFVLGAGQVIPGWDQGFDGMKIGGRRRLVIPPGLAYGPEGAGGGIIPPNATLIFEMELLDVQQ